MYKLFLCLKYLRRRYLALIAVAAVALCVAMVLIVVSVYDGFLSKVERAAKGLFGDIIVHAPSLSAIGRYDEFISELTGRYRFGADFELAGVKPDGQASEVVFQAKAGPAHAEALAGNSKFDRPVAHPARGTLFKAGRRLGEVRGQLVLRPGRLNRESEEFEYEARFVGKTDLPADRFADPGDPIRLHAVYAKVGDGMAEVESATPVIYAFGLLRIAPDFTTYVRICGIRLPERLGVTDFAGGLFVQSARDDASFGPPLTDVFERTREHLELIREIHRRELARPPGRRDAELRRKLLNGWDNALKMLGRLDRAILLTGRLRKLQGDLAARKAKPPQQRDEGRIAALSQGIEQTLVQLNEVMRAPAQRVILGLGIGGLSFRTPDGETVRWVSPGKELMLTLWPLRRGRQTTTITPSISTFTVIDDAKTDVWTVDSTNVYVPFDKLQELSDMGSRPYADDPSEAEPALCSQIQIKVRQPFSTDRKLIEVRKKVEAAWRVFEGRRPDAADLTIQAETWRERLAAFIGPIQKQRTLVTVMFGIISFVSVLLIFAIFYMIVMQKTRDIGVIRAVGGSAAGVAQMFLAYGAATGLVGSILGLVGGYYFVRYINEVEDLMARWWGFRVWDRDVFLFDKIPNEVDPSVAFVIAVWAIASGLVGALIPAIRAAVMEPAEAVRYE